MRRITTFVVMVGIILPTLVGLFPVSVKAQLLPGPVDCVLEPFNLACLDLPSTPECTFLGQNNVNSLEEVDSEITRNDNAVKFIQENLSLLEEALDLLKRAEDAVTFIAPSGPGGGGVSVGGNVRDELREQAREKLDEFEQKYGSQQLNVQEILNSGSQLNRLFGIEDYTELARETDIVIKRLKERQQQFIQQKLVAQICHEQAQITPDQTSINDYRNQLGEARRLELGILEEERDLVEAQGERFKEDLTSFSNCVGWRGFELGACLRDLIGWVFKILNSLATWLLTWISAFFNYIIKFSIVDFKTLVDGTGDKGGLAIMTLWRTFRDIANMFAIFLLLYIALGTILQTNRIDTPKALTSLIVVALLINFSGVFTRIAIDGSNVMSLVFYSRFSTEPGQEPNIAGVFTKASRIDAIMGTKVTTTANDTPDDTTTAFIAKSLGTLIVLLVTCFVLFMASGFFLVRTVALILLIITSPIAMMGMVIPWLNSQVTQKWKKELISQLTFAPVFMCLLYISLSIARNAPDVDFGPGITDNLIGNIIIYTIINMMLIGSLMIARSSASGVASSKIKGFGMAGLAATGAGIGVLGTNRWASPAKWAQKQIDSGKGNWLTSKAYKQMATGTWNPVNAIKATDNKMSSLISGKGIDFNNRSYAQKQKDDKEKAKTQAEDLKKKLKAIDKSDGSAAAADYMESLSESQRSVLYESLTTSERGKYESAANESTKKVWKKLREDLKDEDAKKQSNQAVRRADRDNEVKKNKNALINRADPGAELKDSDDQLYTSTDSNEVLIKAVGARGLTDIADTQENAFKEILTNREYYQHFNNEQMQAIYDLKRDGALSDEQWTTLAENIKLYGANSAKRWVAKRENIPVETVLDRASGMIAAEPIIEDIKNNYNLQNSYDPSISKISRLNEYGAETLMNYILSAPEDPNLSQIEKNNLDTARNKVIGEITEKHAKYLHEKSALSAAQKNTLKTIALQVGNNEVKNYYATV